MNASRSPTAPSVPETRPRNCWRLGRLWTASAMTSALSPASVRSMMMMPKTRAQNSGSIKNVMASLHQRLHQRDQHPTDHHQRDGDGQALDSTDSHLVSPLLTIDEQTWPPGGGVVQETDGMTELVVF